jgi:hypothetical protein
VNVDIGRKLGIRPGHRVLVREECSDLLEAMSEYLPPNVSVSTAVPPPGKIDIVILRPDRAELPTLFKDAKSWIVPNGAVWVVVKRKPYRGEGDVSFEAAQAEAFPLGLVYDKEFTLGETEYATRYVIRKEMRPKA